MNTELDRKQFELEFPAITQTVYMNSAGQGPKPRCVIDKVSHYYEKTLLYGASVKPFLHDLNMQVEATRQKAADFFCADKSEVGFIRCIAEGLNILLDGMNLEAGDELITSCEENPAMLIPLRTFAKHKGLVLKKIQLPNNKEEILHNVANAVTNKTRLVVLSHVTHTRGLCIPVKEIACLCHEKGALLALDGAQGAGQIPVDMKCMGFDCYWAAGYKWMFGLHGTTIALMSKSLLEAFDLKYGGVGSQEKYDFKTDAFSWRKDARQLEYGSRHWPLYLGLGESMSLISSVGIPRIQSHVLALCEILRREMEALGFFCESPEDPALMSGIMTFSREDVDCESLVSWLYNAHRILTQFRDFAKYRVSAQGLRISLAFFTTKEEVEHLIRCVKQYLNEVGNGRGK